MMNLAANVGCQSRTECLPRVIGLSREVRREYMAIAVQDSPDGEVPTPGNMDTTSFPHFPRDHEPKLCIHIRRSRYSTLPDRDAQDQNLKHDYAVRGGDYMEIFHNQTQSYLAVDTRPGSHIPLPKLYRPIADSRELDPQLKVAAEFVWKIMPPRLAWSGSKVTASDAGDKRTRPVCLNAAMVCGEELFLAESDDGTPTLSANAEDPLAQWHLAPLDDDVAGEFHYDETKFYLVNSSTGRILHQGDEEERPAHAIEDPTAWFNLDVLDTSSEHESDVFVLHALGMGGMMREWLQDFQAGEEGMDGLWRFQHGIEKVLALRSCLEEKKDAKQVKNVMPHISLRLSKHHHKNAAKKIAADQFIGQSVEESQDALWTAFVRPPKHHWDDWAAPVLTDIRIFISNLITGTGDDPLAWNGIVDKQQQEILSGLGLVKFVVHLLEAVFALIGEDTMNRISNIKLDKNRSTVKEDEEANRDYWGHDDIADTEADRGIDAAQEASHDRFILLLGE